MIAGVKTKELKVHVDDRGFLMEMLRADDPLFERFGQVYVTCCRPGVAKAWHYHKEQTDHFVCLAGSALVVLYDARDGSPTKGEVEEVILEAPPGRLHVGFVDIATGEAAAEFDRQRPARPLIGDRCLGRRKAERAGPRAVIAVRADRIEHLRNHGRDTLGLTEGL